MAVIRELLTRWGIDVDTTTLERFDKKLLDTADRADKVGRGLGKLGQAAKSIGASLALSITAPLTIFGATALKTAGGFEKSMNDVEAKISITGKSIEELTAKAEELGAKTQFSASQAAEAMSALAQAGLDSQQVFDAMPDTLRLAGAASLGMGESAEIVTNIMAGMNLQTKDLGVVVDVLTKAAIASNTDLRQLGEAMKFAGPVAAGFNLSLADTTAVLGVMGNVGIQASMAGTSLRGALTRLATPSKEAGTILKKLGVATHDSNGNVRNFVDILTDLERGGATTSQTLTIFGQRAGPAVAALLDKGTAAIRAFSQELKLSGGTAERIQKLQLRGLFGAWEELKSGIEALQISIAKSGLLEFVTRLTNGLAKLFQRMSTISPSILRFVSIFALLAATIGPLVFVLGTATLAFRALAISAGIANSTILAIPAIIIAVIALIALLADDLIAYSKGQKSVIGVIVGQWPAFKEALTTAYEALQFFRRGAIDVLTEVFVFIGGLPAKVQDLVTSAFNGIFIFLERVDQRVGAFLETIYARVQRVVDFVNGLFGGGSTTVAVTGGTAPDLAPRFPTVPTPLNFTRPDLRGGSTSSVTVRSNVNINVPVSAAGGMDPLDISTIAKQATEAAWEDIVRRSNSQIPELE